MLTECTTVFSGFLLLVALYLGNNLISVIVQMAALAKCRKVFLTTIHLVIFIARSPVRLIYSQMSDSNHNAAACDLMVCAVHNATPFTAPLSPVSPNIQTNILPVRRIFILIYRHGRCPFWKR